MANKSTGGRNDSSDLGGGSRDTGRPEELDRDRTMDRDLEDDFDTESPRGSGRGQDTGGQDTGSQGERGPGGRKDGGGSR